MEITQYIFIFQEALDILFLTCYTVSIYQNLIAGCGAVWLARLLWEQEAGGSNPSIPTSFEYGPLAQLAEQATLNRQVGGSMPSRSTIKSRNGKDSESGTPCHCHYVVLLVYSS